MSLQMEKIANKAFDLSNDERAELAHKLILSLDNHTDQDIETAWNLEIERRITKIKNGTAKGRPAEEIFAEIRTKYQ